jgi:hypothetical protein
MTRKRFTQYEWRRMPQDAYEQAVLDTRWQSYRQWPTYDFNDGTWGGLPHSLRKMYERNRAVVEALLTRQPVPDPAQPELLRDGNTT